MFLASKADLSAVAQDYLPAAPGSTTAAYVMGGTLAASIRNRMPPREVGAVIGAPLVGNAYLTVGSVGVVDLGLPDPGGDLAFMLAIRAPNVDASTPKTVRPLSSYSTATNGLFLHATVGPTAGDRSLRLQVGNSSSPSDDVTVSLAIPALTPWLCTYVGIRSGSQAVVRNLTAGTSAQAALTIPRVAGPPFRLGANIDQTDLSTQRDVDVAGLTFFKPLPSEAEIQATYSRLKKRMARFGHVV